MAPKRRTSLADMAKATGSNRKERDYTELQKDIKDEDEPKKRLNVHVPASLYMRLKRKCMDNDISITQAMLGLIRDYIGEDE